MKNVLYQTLHCSLFILLSLYYQAELHAQVSVGVSAPLTGICAEYGTSVKRGIILAQKEQKSSSVRFVFEDNAYDARKSISAYRSLKDIKKVSAIYSWGEIPLVAVSNLAEKDRMPLLVMSNDDRLARDRKYILNMQLPPEKYAAALKSQLDKKGIKKVAFLVAEDPFTEAMARGMREQPGMQEGIVSEVSVSPDLSDFRSEILKLKNKSFDALGVYLLPGQVGVFAKQARAAGIGAFLFGADSFESSTEYALSSGALSGSLYTNIGVPNEFVSKIKEYFPSEEKPGFVWDSYLFAKASMQVFEKGQVKDPLTITKSYRSAIGGMGIQVLKSTHGMEYTDLPLALRTFDANGKVADY